MSLELSIYWADSLELLTREERNRALQYAKIESITEHEVLLREMDTKRLIVIVATKPSRVLYCSLCKDERTRLRYGHACPGFVRCCFEQR